MKNLNTPDQSPLDEIRLVGDDQDFQDSSFTEQSF